MSENSVVLRGLVDLPSAEARGKFGRPSRAGFLSTTVHQICDKAVLRHTLKPAYFAALGGTAKAVPCTKTIGETSSTDYGYFFQCCLAEELAASSRNNPNSAVADFSSERWSSATVAEK